MLRAFLIAFLLGLPLAFGNAKPNANLKSPSVLENTPTQQLYDAQTASFIVISDATMAINYVLPIVRVAENAAYEFFGFGGNAALPKIVLQIVSQNNDKFDSGVSASYKNEILLSAKFNEKLLLEDFCSLISNAVLYRAAQSFGYEPNKIPLWLKLGFAEYVYQKASIGELAQLVRYALENKKMQPKELFALKENDKFDAENAKCSAYWTLLTIRDFLDDKAVAKKTMLYALSGKAPENTLLALEKNATKANFKKLWLCVYNHEIYSRKGGVMTFGESAEFIKKMCFVCPDFENAGFADKAVLLNCEDPKMQAMLKQRITEIKMALSSINGAYFNTLLSLGEMFEAALDSDSEKFEKSRREFIENYKYSKVVENAAKKLMQAK